MDSELFYNTPVFDKDNKYCDCENCDGLGYFYFESDACDEGTNLEKCDCPECDGEGQLLIE